MRTWNIPLSILIAILVTACAAADDPVVSALLRGDWDEVLQASSAGATQPTHHRILKAHANLALNNNNDATCGFAGVVPEELGQWDDWTLSFVLSYPDSTVANYLRGDALARQNRLNEALTMFDAALAETPDHPLTLNARGVVRSLLGDWEAATRDFYRAAEVRPGFADARSSRGFSYIHRKRGASGALRAFYEALEISPEFGLALAGKGYSVLALNLWDNGERDIETAAGTSACAAELLARESFRLVAWLDEKHSSLGDDAGADAPGTQFDRALTQVSEGNTRALGRVAREIGRNPRLADRFGQTLAGIKQNNPELYTKITDRMTSAADWTQKGRGADRFLNLTQGLVGKVFGDRSQFHSEIERQRDLTRTDFKGWSTMNKAWGRLDPIQPKGVTTRLADARIDEGDWPFGPIYGLLYPVEPNEGGTK